MSGKSTLLTMLRNAMKILREEDSFSEEYFKIDFSIFNPKAITIEELYGSFDKVTQSWNDGIASKLIR